MVSKWNEVEGVFTETLVVGLHVVVESLICSRDECDPPDGFTL